MTTESLTDQVCQIAADIFNVEPADLGPETSGASIDSWDSMQHLNLVLALEQEFGVALGPEEIEAMTTIAAIVEVIEATRRG